MKRGLVLLVMIRSALAHTGQPPEPHDLAAAWTWAPGICIPLAISAFLYLRGARTRRGIRRWEAVSFAGGWLMLAVALISPVHALGEALFSAHMVQHELLMIVAAPLLVAGRPLVPFLWGLPISWRRGLGAFSRGRAVQSSWHFLTDPFVAWSTHAAVLWGWHLPALFQATLTSDAVHTAQHFSFLFSALLFWWAVLRGRTGRMTYGMAILYVFTTGVHTSILGALLTFSPRIWYPAYIRTAPAWGLTALEDQQLGGLIMWIPAGIVYIVAGLALAVEMIRRSEYEALAREADRV